MFNLKEELAKNYGKHRSGWSYVVNGMEPLHSNNAPELVSFIEKKFIFGGGKGDFNNKFEPLTKPWVGFLHVPVNVPHWFNRHYSPVELFKRGDFQEALTVCEGIYTLSSPLSDWVSTQFDGPVNTVLHPTELVDNLFDNSILSANNPIKIVQLGFWLRKLHAIHKLKLPSGDFKKYTVGISQVHQQRLINIEKQVFDIDYIDDSVENIGFMSNDEYDNLLSKSIVFIDFYDTSANNAIIECIARATPVLCPPNRAIVDYLGTEYPLYFNSYEEAQNILMSRDKLMAAHHYLLESGVRYKLTIQSFLKTLKSSL
ncbi:hypothetical protein Q4567_00115 [Aliiglaciecola sp. 2_MG-2023]|uniref:hypothetical protein n=1 Tax=unclassified Aliiglaciecola TaxID=2593648 RepID=UPI0026E2DACD|nr:MULTISPECIES: hypothetical protein [unclassified Aliiglaciecola]MDO6709111.1 hypothetical protein [Aliiglaciecola sp. 2_MG-2023]MDO6750259.1 hypothetical protein [Aliiglaciecola sp. 1_MG-2023]